MNPELRAKLQALGAELSLPMIQATRDLMAAQAAPADSAVEVTRDCQYGPDARNRLDVFRKGAPVNAPVLVYVHGGGFVMGDKTTPGSPFFDNIGQWAARQGWIGVTMTYRLAPAHRWPSGPEDVALAVNWLQQQVAAFGGNPRAIFLVGQSAGACHVGAYIAHARFHAGEPRVAGAVLISGVLDLSVQPPNQYHQAYFGGDAAAVADAASIQGLVATRVPLLFSVSEFDPRDFQEQALLLAKTWQTQKQVYPPLVYLAGHNHLSPAQSIGSAEDVLARHIADFVAVNRP